MSRFIAVLTSKGQFTLPREVRDAMRVEPGDRLEFFVSRTGKVIMQACNRPASAIFGKGKAFGKNATEDARIQSVAAAVAERGSPGALRKAG